MCWIGFHWSPEDLDRRASPQRKMLIGISVVGTSMPTVALSCFLLHTTLMGSHAQVATMPAGLANLTEAVASVWNHTSGGNVHVAAGRSKDTGSPASWGRGELEFEALMRMLDHMVGIITHVHHTTLVYILCYHKSCTVYTHTRS